MAQEFNVHLHSAHPPSAEAPEEETAYKVGTYLPLCGYTCMGFLSVEVTPSLKSHL